MTAKTIPERPEYAGVFPPNFLHGYASAAYQIEGAATRGGRGPCNWDKILKNKSNGDDACRSYELWQDDVKLLKQYGANSYRFSVSWSRIKPQGNKDSPVNEEGVAYYNKLIDALVAAGVEPTITLHHYDTPLALEEKYDGFAAMQSDELVSDFVAYARLCYERFGDRVKRWLTINEPYIFTAHCMDGLIPGCTRAQFFRVGHNCLLTHGYAAKLYREEFQKSQGGIIGVALNNEWVSPLDDSPEAKEATRISEQRTLGWFALPIFKGTQTKAWDNYGEIFPHLTEEELKVVHGSADFFSINHYGTAYATGKQLDRDTGVSWWGLDDIEKTFHKDGQLIGRRGENGHPHTVPWGFRDLLVHCWEAYAKEKDLPMIIYENGYSVEHEADKPLDQIIDDKYRQEYLDQYISALCDAVKDHGAKIVGYHCWSLLDNLEWHDGYGPRFGVTYIDKENGFKRIPKDSPKVLEAIWEHTVRK